jgi:tRNA G10  N-methylase Trm11
MYIALLGRQPELSVAELEQLYGDVEWFSPHTALFTPPEVPAFNIQRLGGTQKAGVVIAELPLGDWRKVSDAIVKHYAYEWASRSGKITVGISVYDFIAAPRDIQKTGLLLKSKLKQSGVSLRLIPNQEAALSTATSHHNKLGLADNKVELLVVRGGKSIIIAESTGTQNITALAARDQGRPRRDAFVGMLPPKLAQIMINLAVGTPNMPTNSDDSEQNSQAATRVLDPFCGTGVLLQEAALLRYTVYGTDLSEKMVAYSKDNLNWLKDQYNVPFDWLVHQGDAMDTQWQHPIDAVVTEAYLGQPFSAPPSPSKLAEVQKNCDYIISTFLTNLSKQLKPGTPVVLAIPAWRNKEDTFTHLPLIQKIGTFGFERVTLKSVDADALAYFRPDQVVAREILILKKR